MYRIRLDAARWQTTDDFYADLLPALKAPAWHGRSLDALWDTLTERAKFNDLTVYINGVQPPFRIDVLNVEAASELVQAFLPRVERLFALANSEYEVSISIVLWRSERPSEPAESRSDNSPP